MRAAARFGIAVFLALAPAAAYYHYNHYTTRLAPYQAIQEKFDLNVLPNRTVTFFVTDSAQVFYGPNDSFASVLSQVRQAAAAWNAVETSDLRVAFGGLYTFGTPQNTPSGMVMFEDLPPGVLGLSSRNVGVATMGSNGMFVPIAQGMVRLNRNMTVKPGPSYLESFFTTTVHEMGHALGLQHTFTSSAMSTGMTRTTSRARPLEADDVAGISLLYPGRSFAASFGSITGRVTTSGQGVHMASVVALRPAGSAISTLTNPDGTYRIDGLPPDTYWVYVHPLPPTADIALPLDPSGMPVPASGPVETLFYPGTRDPQQFIPIPVTRGAVVTGIDFSVQRRDRVPLYDTFTYSFAGGAYITPAYMNPTGAETTMVAGGTGLMTPSGPPPGLSVNLLGGFGGVNVRPFGEYLALYFYFPPFAGAGPRHLLFRTAEDAWVLPAALSLVQKAPPVIASVTPNPDGTVTVIGSNLGPDSRIYFDGLPGTVRAPFSGSDQMGAVMVQPPPGANGQIATVSVVNADGQHSMLLQALNPPVYNYGFSDAASISLSPNVLPAGVSSMVEITGVNTRFADGLTTVGFGSSDVFVRRIWVLSPTRLLANVMVAAGAPTGVALPVTVMSGFQTASQQFAFAVQPALPRLPSITLPVVNANPTLTGVYPGAVVTVYGVNLSTGSNTTVTLNDQPAQVSYAAPNQINFAVPLGTPVGPAILRIHNGAEAGFPVVVQVDAAPGGQFSSGDEVPAP
ncbi:MAG: IPT/TIG domain-containing protein [Bryobacteraceae bacterium]